MRFKEVDGQVLDEDAEDLSVEELRLRLLEEMLFVAQLTGRVAIDLDVLKLAATIRGERYLFVRLN